MGGGPAGVRINKLMATMGWGSRRRADEFIKQGMVRVNGVVAAPGTRVTERDLLDIDPAARAALREENVSVVLHKPYGVVSGQPEDGHYPAIKYLTKESYMHAKKGWRGNRMEPYKLERLACAGRLDIYSTGLLLFTQDGEVARRVIGPTSTVEKEYLVRWRHAPNESMVRFTPAQIMESLEKLRGGVEDGGELLTAVRVDYVPLSTVSSSSKITPLITSGTDLQLKIVLQSGKKHHIRRMLDAVGWKVLALKRVRIGSITLGSLYRGKWRYVRPDELEKL